MPPLLHQIVFFGIARESCDRNMAYNRRGIRIISLANSDKLSGAKVWYQTLRNHHDYCLPPYPFREPGQSHPLYKKGNLYKFGYGRRCLTELSRQKRPPSTALPGRVSSSVIFLGDHTFNADSFYFHVRNPLNGLFC